MKRALDILLIEDNLALSGNIGEYLETSGHRVDFAYDGASGLARALEGTHDVVILDLALPRVDGLAVCRQLREKADRHIPVIMLTARDTLDDKLEGFKGGADDYLTKPCALAELAARCAALAQRPHLGRQYTLRVGPLEVNRRQNEARRNGELLRLTPITFQILVALAEAHPAPIARAELSRLLWGDEPPDSDSLRSHVHLLRQTLDRPFAWPMLETVHGVGFRLREQR